MSFSGLLGVQFFLWIDNAAFVVRQTICCGIIDTRITIKYSITVVRVTWQTRRTLAYVTIVKLRVRYPLSPLIIVRIVCGVIENVG